MKKHFYQQIIVIDSIHLGLETLDLSPEEKQELVEIVENNMHHIVVDTVLSELEENDKKTFLALITQPDQKHDLIWAFLEMKVDQAEVKIKEAVKAFEAEILKDILELKVKA